jgi:hypothetical protein
MVFPRLALSSVLAASACQQLQVPGDSGDGGDGPSSSSDEGGTFFTSSADSSGGVGSEGGGMSECDPVAQLGCIAGEKCTAVLVGNTVAYACVADSPAHEPNAPCTASPNTGVDGCPDGYACIADEVDSALCVELCLADADCGGGLCVDGLVAPIPYCAGACSPFENMCATPLQCRASADRFTCRFAHETDVGGQGDPCSVPDDVGCGEGFVCIPGELVPGCVDPACCTTLCDVNDGIGCDAPAGCQSIFGAPAPGYEDVGACFVPA